MARRRGGHRPRRLHGGGAAAPRSRASSGRARAAREERAPRCWGWRPTGGDRNRLTTDGCVSSPRSVCRPPPSPHAWPGPARFFIIKTPALRSVGHDTESPAFEHAVDVATERASHDRRGGNGPIPVHEAGPTRSSSRSGTTASPTGQTTTGPACPSPHLSTTGRLRTRGSPGTTTWRAPASGAARPSGTPSSARKMRGVVFPADRRVVGKTSAAMRRWPSR
jgi:hypothetical protein